MAQLRRLNRTHEKLPLAAPRANLCGASRGGGTRTPAATTIAREAIAVWLRARKKALRHKAIADYAAEAAGTEFDLDPLLESAAVEQLMKPHSKRDETWRGLLGGSCSPFRVGTNWPPAGQIVSHDAFNLAPDWRSVMVGSNFNVRLTN